MSRLTLNARLALIFATISIASLSAVGIILYQALSVRIYAQDDINIILAARYLRRYIADFDSIPTVRAHADRLVSIVQGDAALDLNVIDVNDTSIIHHQPPQIPLHTFLPVFAENHMTENDVHRWRRGDGVLVCGVTALAHLKNGTSVMITVERTMKDRDALLQQYRRTIWATVAIGTLVTMLLSYALARRALAPLRAIANNAKDITAHRLHKRINLSEAPPELHDLADALNKMLTGLQEGFTRSWEFTADLAHDLRTPIANLRGAAEVTLTRTRPLAEYQTLLVSNIEEYERISRMIENVLFLARAENPRAVIKCRPFAADDELCRIAGFFEGAAAEAHLDLIVDGRAQVFADPELFRRAVVNLLDNAIRHTPPNKRITLKTWHADDACHITVENPGAGIPAELHDKIFDRFYRIDKSRAGSASSTGLGLAIVKTIMDLHHGTARVQSELRTMTRFELIFPDAPHS